MAYYPLADKSITGKNSGTYTGGPPKGILHTTEGQSASGAIGAFKSTGSWPHFLIDYTGKIWQFIDTSRAARALRNLPGGVETNRDYAIQIEIVGFAGKPKEHPPAQMAALKLLMRWIEATEGVKPIGPGRPFATAYGQKNLRFTNAEWDSFAGYAGHCHIPEQDHWDPGAIDLISLLPSEKIVPDYNPPMHINDIVSVLSPPTGGGLWLLGAHGEIYAFLTRDLDAPNRHPEYWTPDQLAAKLVPSPNGLGYTVIDVDGQRYDYNG